jgi:hypothetical protein
VNYNLIAKDEKKVFKGYLEREFEQSIFDDGLI